MYLPGQGRYHYGSFHTDGAGKLGDNIFGINIQDYIPDIKKESPDHWGFKLSESIQGGCWQRLSAQHQQILGCLVKDLAPILLDEYIIFDPYSAKLRYINPRFDSHEIVLIY